MKLRMSKYTAWIGIFALTALTLLSSCGKKPEEAATTAAATEAVSKEEPDIVNYTSIDYTGFYKDETGQAEIEFVPDKEYPYRVHVSVQRLCSMDGIGTWMDGAVEIMFKDPNGNDMCAVFFPEKDDTFTLRISQSQWDLLPAMTDFSGFTRKEKAEAVSFTPMYNPEDQVIRLSYEGIDYAGLESANKRYGSEGYGDQGCSITFATYRNGTTGAVRNMDLHLSDYTSYEIIMNPGENVKYATWGLAYTGVDEKSHKEILETGISEGRYQMIPFTATDTMSFGYKEDGTKGSLYCALLIRGEEQDEDGNYIWTCPGTNPGAPLRCCTMSVATLIATQNLSIEEALKYVGAVDEEYKRLYPDVEPTLDIYSLNVETETASNHWFEVCAMMDDTGRHGVLEFIDNYPIWHEGADYSFNFFLQEDYLHNPDGTYRETGGSGIGRMEATIPYLDKIHTVADHEDLMDGVRYSYMTYYNEDAGYVGYDWNGQPVDWRSEHTHADVWGTWEKMNKELGIDTAKADEKYPLYARYFNTETGELELIDSYEKYVEKREHLKTAYDMNYVLADENKDELMNYVRWTGYAYDCMTEEQAMSTHNGWETYFRVIADPMNGRVTRWFNENHNTADTISFADIVTE